MDANNSINENLLFPTQEEQECFWLEVLETVRSVRIKAIEIGYSLESIHDEQIIHWISHTPLRPSLLHWQIEEWGRKLPQKETFSEAYDSQW